MRAESATKIEAGVDQAAAALFACAAAYAASAGLASYSISPVLAAESAAVAVLAYVICARALKAVQPEARKAPVAVFDVRQIESMEAPELLLTERHDPETVVEEPLVLDDILAELGPDSRVVRLFDPAAMPTPGELNRRVESHLMGGTAAAAPDDASQALHEALAELRRSLR